MLQMSYTGLLVSRQEVGLNYRSQTLCSELRIHDIKGVFRDRQCLL
jgi:hypothetical protein